MKKFTSLLISCSLALAGAAMAQQPEDQASPKPKEAAEKGKGHHPGEAKPEAAPAKPAAVAPEHHEAKHAPAEHKPDVTKAPEAPKTEKPEAAPMKPHAAKEAAKEHKPDAAPKPAASPATAPEASGQPAAMATPGEKQHKGKKGMKPEQAAKAPATPAPAKATPAPATAASAAPATQPKPNTAAMKKPEPQKIKEIKAEHASFHAQARPEQVPAVTFHQDYRIQGSDQWQGQQYEVFRSYHPERHDQGWYRSHYSRVELVGGGYYYEHNGYWYPAWGYNTSSEYYAYDGPIYVGHRAEPPDRVIADVQAALQHLGYYKGEVDGLLGPLSREAITGYQNDQGLVPTAVIDEPTLDALGMG